MKLSVADFSKNSVDYIISDTTLSELENKLTLFFTAEGYKLKLHAGDAYTFEKGNRVLRILFGAFVTYHKQKLTVKESNGQFSVQLLKSSSGMSGGLIGMQKSKKEFSRIQEALKAYLG
jgi:hypothetical protein